MAETRRTLADLITLFADNDTGQISEQDARDALWSFNCLCGPEISVTGAVVATVGQMHVCSGTAADYTVTLPPVANCSGRFIGFRMDAGLTRFVTLDGNAAELIDGAATRVMWSGESAILYCDGAAWYKVAGKTRPMIARGDIGAAAINNSSTTQLQLTSGFDNTGRMVDTATDRITIRRPGVYDMLATVRWDTFTAAGTWVRTDIRLNGVTTHAGDDNALSSGNITVESVHAAENLALSDYLEVYAFQQSGAQQVIAEGQVGIEERPTW